MSESTDHFHQALNEWLARHTRVSNDVFIEDLGGRLCAIKVRRLSALGLLSYCIRYLRASLISVFCWLGFREKPSARILLRNGLEAETQRLLLMQARGYRVPKVLHHAPGVLVLSYEGESLTSKIREADFKEQLVWMDLAAQDLAQFHQAGFVHGGAQLRNLMVQDGVLTRIDFEENIAEALSRPLGQAYDVYHMMSSMAGLRVEQFSELERRALCARLLDAYLQANPDPAVRMQLTRLGRLFAVVQHYLGWLLRRLPGRDVRGFLYVTDALRL